jgi:hypothetical protein
MPTNRRDFLQKATGLAASASLASFPGSAGQGLLIK